MRSLQIAIFLTVILPDMIVVGIVGGKDAKIEDFPYVAQIQQREKQKDPWTNFCTAVILSEDWIITSALCLQAPMINRRVLAGFVDISDPNKQIRTIKHVKRHPHFDRKFKIDKDDAVFENDIAVLELDTPFTFGPTCNKLPYSTSKDVVDKNRCRISGWGGIDINETDAEILQYTDISVLTLDECDQLTEAPLVNSQICAIDKNLEKQACYGDGGGPLTCLAGKTRVLCGLFSWLYTFCDGDNPFAYTNVTHYASWIKRETGIEGFP
ncbi:Hypothetical predicted protein [Mytilus galloprovincialis]|uniref:Peptidase S1 domain-containing protein n=1 Tax=Mytilus galloprovincialis TaxID=29158 RepID=A0A8B6FTT3_MYTGA|nr:Hypothetical predicted protein [Mytilus galloprovincialis]